MAMTGHRHNLQSHRYNALSLPPRFLRGGDRAIGRPANRSRHPKWRIEYVAMPEKKHSVGGF